MILIFTAAHYEENKERKSREVILTVDLKIFSEEVRNQLVCYFR